MAIDIRVFSDKEVNLSVPSGKNLANLVAGQDVEVEYKKRDRYGRIIGKLIKDGQDINSTADFWKSGPRNP